MVQMFSLKLQVLELAEAWFSRKPYSLHTLVNQMSEDFRAHDPR
jgi:hypothetical protein